MADTGKRIFDTIKNDEDFVGRARLTPTLEEAVKVAKAVTPKGKICLISPAAASYGIFKNFEHRGDEFKRLVFEK
jgi:UDP-N-acetylmuramoylalanine--D-glutamate ligase